MSVNGERSLGCHLLADFRACSASRLDDIGFLEELLLRAARAAGATVVESLFHHFAPHGVSGVVVVSESHLALHTWPEYGCATFDFFTCGVGVDPERAAEVVRAGLGAGQVETRTLERGRFRAGRV